MTIAQLHATTIAIYTLICIVTIFALACVIDIKIQIKRMEKSGMINYQ
jgi:hypothetical protein